jgi:hypothetical protein
VAAELKATNPAINIEILGVNMAPDYLYNNLVTDERSLPWLQDNSTNSAWAAWKVTLRDVRILDTRNRLFAIYNLSVHDLSYPSNRITLKQLFLDAARFVDTDGDGLLDDWEMLNFGDLSATPGGDPDGDGQDNRTEYAFGTRPNDATSKSSFLPVVIQSGPDRYFTLTFRRRAGSCLDYIIESSPDLRHWSSSPGTINVDVPFRNLFDGTGTGESSCTLTAPIQSQPYGFLRVRAVIRTP